MTEQPATSRSDDRLVAGRTRLAAVAPAPLRPCPSTDTGAAGERQLRVQLTVVGNPLVPVQLPRKPNVVDASGASVPL